jgi:3-dehydroquinate dehydratase-2
MRKTRLLVVNGPNINMLGTREPALYGGGTYQDLLALLEATARALGCDMEHVQSNAEGELVTAIQEARGRFDAAVVNAAAYTHTSIAVRDALLASELPFVEVHVSNVYKREAFRRRSYLSDIAVCVICGAGIDGYRMGMEFAARRFGRGASEG